MANLFPLTRNPASGTVANLSEGVDVLTIGATDRATPGGLTVGATKATSIAIGAAVVTTAGVSINVEASDIDLVTNTSGDINISGLTDVDINAGVNAEITAGANVDVDAATDVDIDAAAGHVSLDAVTASNFSVVGGVLTLEADAANVVVQTTGASGDVEVLAVDNIVINATTADVDIDAGAGNVTIDAGVDITADATGLISLDAGAASNFSVTGFNLSLQTLGGAGDIIIDAIDTIDMGAGVDIDIDSTAGHISLDGVTNSNFTVDGANLDLETTTTGDVNVNAVDILDMDGDLVELGSGGNIDIDAADAITIDANDTSNFSVVGANLTLETTTSGNVNIKTTTAGNVVIDSDDNVDIDAALAVTIDANDVSNFTVDSANLTLKTTTSGDVIVDGKDNVYINVATVPSMQFTSTDIDLTSDIDIQTTYRIDYEDIQLTAYAGSETLPSNPVGFFFVKIKGSDMLVPYYYDAAP